MIPIGRDLSAEPFTERASISGDGSLLAITLHRSDAVAEGLGIEGETDVYLYRVETQTFEAVNLSGEGVPGVRSSLRGVISASGREIAFASAMGGFARSGAAGDTNVLLRDLVDGSIERVSVPLAGARDEERRSDQFLPFPQVDISGDGRYVLFSSSADDLTEASTGCRFPAILRCNGVYLRDLATKETTLLAPAAPEESFFGDLDISTDGGRAMVQEYLFFCAPEEACSTLWLIDTQSGRRIGLPGGTPVAEDPNGRTSPFLSLHTESSVGTLAFSPTGASIAAGGGDGIVRIWDVASGKLTISLREHDLPVTGLAYGDAGRALYSAARDRSLRAWRLPDATLMYTTREAFGDLSGLDTDSQGNLLAAGSYGRAWVWRITAAGSPSLRETIDLGGGRITSVSISGGGELLALGTSEGSVEIHRMADGRLLLHLGDHPEKIPTLSFSPDGQYLAYGSADGTLNLWGLDGNAEEGLLAEYLLSVQHPAWINAVAFLPNRPVLAYSNLRDEVYLRRIPDGELIGELGTLEGNVVSSLAVSPEGKLLAVGTVGGEIHLWNLDFIATGPERGG
jgi:WD40 repeat protein